MAWALDALRYEEEYDDLYDLRRERKGMRRRRRLSFWFLRGERDVMSWFLRSLSVFRYVKQAGMENCGRLGDLRREEGMKEGQIVCLDMK